MEAQASAFGHVYGDAMYVVVLAALMTLSLRRTKPLAGAGQPDSELASSAL